MKRLFWLLPIMFILLCNQSAMAKEWPARTDVSIYKVWTITFSKPVDAITINDNTIYVTESNGNIFPTELLIAPDNKSLIVVPKQATNYKYGTTYGLNITAGITSSGKPLNEVSTMNFTTISDPISNILTINDLVKYLNNNFTTLETPIGTWHFTNSISENTFSFIPYDYWIKTDFVASTLILIDLEYSIKYTDAQKEETKKLLRDYQQSIANIVNASFPGKKVIGGFYRGYYKYPNLKLDYTSIRFLTWKNFDGYGDYKDSKITGFHWDASIDDYDFTK